MAKAKVAPSHPQIDSYASLLRRAKSLSGLYAGFVDDLVSEIACGMAERGRAEQKFPISSGVLLSSDLLTSQGFSRAQDRNAVPQWRDGVAGERLQRRQRAQMQHWLSCIILLDDDVNVVANMPSACARLPQPPLPP